MAKPLVPDELWELLAPLLPLKPPKPTGGRPRGPDRKVLTGILFVLQSGLPWERLPREMGCGSGMTCWRRLPDWHHTGVWHQLHRLLLVQLQEADKIDWSRALVDSRSVRAVGGGEKTRSQSDGPAQTGEHTSSVARCQWDAVGGPGDGSAPA
jgi:transposase